MKKIILIIIFVFFTSLAGVIVKTGIKSTKLNESKKTYVAGCVAKEAGEQQCECSFNKIIEKYGYEEYISLAKELGTSGMEGIKTNPKLIELVSFLTEEIPKLCGK